MPTLEEYQQYIESGGKSSDELTLEDAAPAEETETIGSEVIEVEPEENQDESDEAEELEDSEEDLEGEPEGDYREEGDKLPEKQQTAFQKRLEREKRKLEEEIRKQVEEQYTAHNTFFQTLGVDPQTAIQAMEQQAKRNEALRLQEAYGWDDNETSLYLRQRELEEAHTQLRIQNEILALQNNPQYEGLNTLRPQIETMVKRNPQMTVEQAYWAVGGPTLVEQTRLEAKAREAARRAKPKRKVVTETVTPANSGNDLTPEMIATMRMFGLTEKEVQALAKAPAIKIGRAYV